MTGRRLPDAVAPLVVAAAVFALYALGACPTVYVGDSGELVAAVHTLGIPHPSGYPLYVLLGKLWTLIVPIGSVALRMSLFSAACAALSCGLLFHLAWRRLRLDASAAALSASLLAVAPSFWAEANVPRVYALNALFVVAATGLALAWRTASRDRTLGAAFFACGLGATNHTFMAVYALALALFVAARRRPAPGRMRTAAWAAGGFVAGLVPYLFLLLRSRSDPRLDWGNPETPSALLDVVLRRSFWQRAWLESPADLVPIAADYLVGLGAELHWLGAALAVAGLAVAWRRGWALLPLLVMAGNLLALAFHGSRRDLFVWHRYYIPSYAMLALLAGVGAHTLLRRAPRALRWLPLVVPLAALPLLFPRYDRSRYRVADDFGRRLLGQLAPGAHLAAGDDNVLFVLLYLALVEGTRPDVDLIPVGVEGAPLQPLRFDPEAEPLYFTHHPNWDAPGLEVVPAGLAFRVARAGRRPPTPPPLPEALEGERDPRVPKDDLTLDLIGHFHFMRGLTLAAREDWPDAADALERAARTAPRDEVLAYNLGLVYLRSGLLPEALASFERAQAIAPRAVAGRRGRPAERVAETRAALERQRALEAALVRELPVELAPGDAAHHLSLAELLEERGYPELAAGHRLRATRVGRGPGERRQPSRSRR